MQNNIYTFAGPLAVFEIDNISLDETVACPSLFTYKTADLIEI